MLGLTDTTNLTSLEYSLPSLKHTVTVHLPGSEAVSNFLPLNSTHRIMEIPCESHWQPGAHWHEHHTEYIRILQGTARVCINGRMQLLQAGEEAVFKPRDVHNFCRAEYDDGPTLLIEEWTDIEDGSKEVFFRNAFSLIGDVDNVGGLFWAFLGFFFLCSYRDNYLAFCPLWTPFWVQKATTSLIFNAVRVIGKFRGWSSWYEAYTPPSLRAVAEKVDDRKDV